MAMRAHPRSVLALPSGALPSPFMGSTFRKLQEKPQRMLKAFPSLFFQSGEHPVLMVNCPPKGVAYSGTHDGAPVSSEVTDPHQVVLWRQKPVRQAPHPYHSLRHSSLLL